MRKKYLFEFWKDIKGYEGLYQVSNLGRVKSYPRYGTTNYEHFLSTEIYKNCRYSRVTLSKNNKTKSFSVHRLVAEAFLPNPFNLPQVNHKDENTANNFVWINEDGSVDFEKSNLEWCDSKYNVNYGTNRTRAAKSCHKPIIGFDGIHKLGTYFSSVTDASNYLGVGKSAITSVLKGYKYCKTACGYVWEYV